MDSVFIPTGNVFEPTELARGPWDPHAQHGGAPSTLIARAFEQIGEGWPFARVEVQLLKPVPLAPIRVEAGVERGGRRARRLRAELFAGDDLVATAAALQLRRGEQSLPDVRLDAPQLPPPETGETQRPPVHVDPPMFGGDGVELRFVRGRFSEPGPAAAWLRLRVPVVPGEDPSPLQRAMAAADFGNGISSAVSWDDYVFINPDLTVYLLREPTGEWIGLDSRTAVDAGGIGLAESTMHDEHGPFGRAVQSLYVSTR
jgi:hypothetical protein